MQILIIPRMYDYMAGPNFDWKWILAENMEPTSCTMIVRLHNHHVAGPPRKYHKLQTDGDQGQEIW